MTHSPRSTAQLAGSIAITGVGVAVADGLAPSGRTLLALLLITIGTAGVSTLAVDHSVTQLERAARRRWIVAFVAFVPYGLATAPTTDAAVAIGESFSGSPGTAALEATAGALVLTAVTTTVMYALARYGLHPGAPTPEERILDEPLDD